MNSSNGLVQSFRTQFAAIAAHVLLTNMFLKAVLSLTTRLAGLVPCALLVHLFQHLADFRQMPSSAIARCVMKIPFYCRPVMEPMTPCASLALSGLLDTLLSANATVLTIQLFKSACLATRGIINTQLVPNFKTQFVTSVQLATMIHLSRARAVFLMTPSAKNAPPV